MHKSHKKRFPRRGITLSPFDGVTPPEGILLHPPGPPAHGASSRAIVPLGPPVRRSGAGRVRACTIERARGRETVRRANDCVRGDKPFALARAQLIPRPARAVQDY